MNVGALALMGVVIWQLGRAAIVDWTTFVPAAVCATLLLTLRVNATWLTLAGAETGLVLRGLLHA